MNEELESLKQAVVDNPNDADAHYRLGKTYLFLKRYVAAVEAFKQVIRIKPDHADTYICLGNAYGNLNRFPEAIEIYKQAIRIIPDNSKAYYVLGISYYICEHYTEAIESFKQAICINPDHALSHTSLGNAYYILNRYDEAIESYKQAISINPNNAELHYDLGEFYRELNRYDEAIESYKQAISINPNNADDHYNLSNIYRKLNRHPEADESVKQAIRINPDYSYIESFKRLYGNFIPELVYITSGEFMMGSEYGSNGRDDEKPLHRVKVNAFYLGKYEVTQREWTAVMGNNPSGFKGDDLPVECVSWNNAQEYLQKLSRITGKHWRLPTEAEWEYACRAGSITKYCFGNKPKRYFFGDKSKQLGEYAWYEENSGGTTHPVGQKKPNAWGLYDMHGNVWEYCQDWYSKYYYAISPIANPTGPSTGQLRVMRGGGWYYDVNNLRSAARDYYKPDGRSRHFGFRCLQEP